MKYLPILVLTFLCNNSQTQCPNGNEIRLKTQEEINAFGRNFPDYQVIEGDLKIWNILPPTLNNYTINDLSPLKNISRITGDLSFGSNTNLVNYKGL